jgi:hypothetical protein
MTNSLSTREMVLGSLRESTEAELHGLDDAEASDLRYLACHWGSPMSFGAALHLIPAGSVPEALDILTGVCADRGEDRELYGPSAPVGIIDLHALSLDTAILTVKPRFVLDSTTGLDGLS